MIPGSGLTLGGLALGGLCLSLGSLAVGCGRGSGKPAQAPPLPGEYRNTRIIHEPCDVSSPGAIGRDVDGDGRSDLISVRVGGVEHCRALDLDFDGTTDVWVYLEPDGKVRRRETDFDRDGQIDEIATFRNGQLIERQQASSPRRALDTWHFYGAGKLLRTLRDADGDGRIDQWWEYPAGSTAEGSTAGGSAALCARVHSDIDGDGRPDPGSTVDLCKEGTPRVASGQSDESSELPAREALPVEVASPPAPAEAPKGGSAP